ncbi:MAG: LytTR family DNA-binding domain-containing protein [Gemmatimonadaceae bacterium]|nr:LytTR family DNA-binding domain-containing protein [Gemmatimonadaceae bacterium]
MRLLIVEDEPLVRERLARLCREHLGATAVIATASDLDDADDALRSRPIDVLLLDLNLGGADGFALLRRTAAAAFHTIVVSAHAERALEAFALGVLDFVPKPFDARRLARALDRGRHAARTEGRSTTHLGVWRPHGVALVAVGDVRRLEADGDYTRLHLADGRRELHDKNLTRLLEVLPPTFVRIHRSHAIPLDRIVRLTSAGGGQHTVLLDDGTELPVARARIAELRARLA